MECPACEGEAINCMVCGQTGQIEIAECPLRIIDAETWQILEISDLFADGLPPIAGGVMDQTVSFICAHRLIQNKKMQWKYKLKQLDW